jgi:hypothetical protein
MLLNQEVALVRPDALSSNKADWDEGADFRRHLIPNYRAAEQQGSNAVGSSPLSIEPSDRARVGSARLFPPIIQWPS